MKLLGHRIRELRENKNISLRDLAFDVGISPAYMSDVERNNRYPTDAKLKIIAEALNVHISAFDEYDTRPPLALFRALTTPNPEYSFALRKLMKSTVSPAEILVFIKQRDAAIKARLAN